MHDHNHLNHAIKHLNAIGITTWIFGGWAEELHGVIQPRLHKDIDLLYPAPDFVTLDRAISTSPYLDPIQEKTTHHKRAVIFQGIMIEFFLVQRDASGWFTDFRGVHRFRWPLDAFDSGKADLRVASPSALASYRSAWSSLR